MLRPDARDRADVSVSTPRAIASRHLRRASRRHFQANPRLPRPTHARRRLFAFFSLVTGLLLAGCGDRGATATANKVPAGGPSAAAAAANTQWPMTRGGPALSGSAAAKLPLHPTTAWTFSAAGPVTGEPAIAGGRVYIGTGTGTLHCLATQGGKELWKFATKDAITAAPAVRGGRVFVSSNDGTLYALNADTGAELWKFSTEDKISSGAIAIQSPDRGSEWVLVNGYDGTARVLNAADGQVVWSYKTDNYINGAPAVVDGRFLVFGGCDAQLHVVNLKDGSPAHKIEANAYIPASIATFGSMAFCGNYANQTVAFDVVAGKIAWVYEDRALPFFSSPAVNDRLVLIGSRDKHLHAIDRKTGEPAWKFQTGGRVEGSPIVFEDAVVFGSSDGRLYAANLEAGVERWQLDLGEPLVASPAFGEQLIVIGGDKGTVFALRAGPAPKKS